MIKALVKVLLKSLLALVVLLFVFLLYEHVRGQVSLASYKRNLRAKGEKLPLNELRTVGSECQNSATEVFKVVEQLQDGTVLPRYYPPIMRMMPSGRAIVGFREPEWIENCAYQNGEWVEQKVTNHWEQMAVDLQTNATVLAQIRLALQEPFFNSQLCYSNIHELSVANLAAAKHAAQWLSAATLSALHEGRLNEAADNLVALVNLSKLLAEEGLVISELVRFAIAGIARAVSWEALQAEGWSDADLARVQETWQTENFLASMVRGFEGERIYGQRVFDQFRRSNDEVVELLSYQDAFGGGIKSMVFGEPFENLVKPPWWRRTRPALVVYSFIWRFAWLDQNERRYLEQMQRLIEATRTAATNKSRVHIQAALAQLDTETTNKNFYHKLRYADSESITIISRSLRPAFRVETERSLVVSAIALKRYKLRYGKLPESLEALVPELLPAVPVDCMDGKLVKYRLNADGSFLLYSVGEDGIDHGGDTTPLQGKEQSRRLWDRRDLVWPAPAQPDEVETYRNEAAN